MPRLWPRASQDPHPWRRCCELKGRGIPVMSGKALAPCAQPAQPLAPGLVHTFPIGLKLPVAVGSCPKSWARRAAAGSLPAHGTGTMAPCPVPLPHGPGPGQRGAGTALQHSLHSSLARGEGRLPRPCSHPADPAVPGAFLA